MISPARRDAARLRALLQCQGALRGASRTRCRSIASRPIRRPHSSSSPRPPYCARLSPAARMLGFDCDEKPSDRANRTVNMGCRRRLQIGDELPAPVQPRHRPAEPPPRGGPAAGLCGRSPARPRPPGHAPPGSATSWKSMAETRRRGAPDRSHHPRRGSTLRVQNVPSNVRNKVRINRGLG